MKKFLIAGFVFASIFSFAQTSKENKIKDLLNLMGVEKNMELAIDQMVIQYKELFPNVPNEYWNKLNEKKNMEDLIKRVIPIYSKHLEEKEVDDLITFYKSPTGKKLIEKLPTMLGESMKEGENWGREIGEKITEELNKENGYESPPPPMK